MTSAVVKRGTVTGRHVRGVLRTLHRWFGLGAAVWLTLLALTGSAIVFYDELDSWLNADWRRIDTTAQTSGAVVGPGAVDAAMVQSRAALPGFTPRFIDLPNDPGQTYMMLGAVRADGQPAYQVQLFADPRDGAVLGWRKTDVVAVDRRHLMNFLYDLHLDLMLGPVATWFLGLLALLWVLDHVFAAILAFPAPARWRDSFQVKGRPSSLKWLFDLHRAVGVWFFPVTLVLAVTSLTLTWQEEMRDAVRLVSPVGERLHEFFPEQNTGAPQVGLEQALAIVASATGAQADSVLLLPHKGAYGVRSFDARDIDGYGRLWTYVSTADGSIMGQRHDIGESAGDLFFAWQYPLHSGKAFGLTGRLVILATGLFTAAISITGVWLWWRRRR